MKNKFLISGIVLALFAFVYSCDDFIEKDLSKKTITVLAPANNYTATNYTQLFWWDEVKGAEEYNLQIVKPSFAATQQLVVDTMVHGNQFSFTLQPGHYQWRLRAQNNSSHTDYMVFNLTVDSSLDIHDQPVPLLSPANNAAFNTFTRTFTWTDIPTATSYQFQVLNISMSILSSTTVGANVGTASYTFPSGGTYYWRVQGQNSYTSTPWSTQTIIIDTTAPPVPVINYLPLNDTTSTSPIPLSWDVSEAGATYRIMIGDTLFSSIAHDTTTTDLNYNFRTSVVNHPYFWKVSAKDAAGNVSSYCTPRKITRH